MVRYIFCSSPCTLTKEVQLFPGLGIYSRILVMYLQCQSNNSTDRTPTVVFYAICLLYVLSTANFVSDLVALIVEVSNNSICSENFMFYQLYRHIMVVLFFPLKLSKAYYPVVVISRPMYLSMHKPLYLSSILFT